MKTLGRQMAADTTFNSMNKNVGIIASVLVGIWLLSNPRCTRGCRTVAQHLLEHGLEGFFGL